MLRKQLLMCNKFKFRFFKLSRIFFFFSKYSQPAVGWLHKGEICRCQRAGLYYENNMKGMFYIY